MTEVLLAHDKDALTNTLRPRTSSSSLFFSLSRPDMICITDLDQFIQAEQTIRVCTKKERSRATKRRDYETGKGKERLTCDIVTDATLTIRIIKSFTYRTTKNLVLHHVNLCTTTVGALKRLVRDSIRASLDGPLRSTASGAGAGMGAGGGWKVYRSVLDRLDTLKIYTVAHGSKTTNLVINLGMEEWVLEDDSQVLNDGGGTTGSTGAGGDGTSTGRGSALNNAEVGGEMSRSTRQGAGVEHETELSFFERAAYDAFLANPEEKWS